ncbi:MAG: hypothetical protein ABL962_01395 [Fimbriimonadaceae bacterium]
MSGSVFGNVCGITGYCLIPWNVFSAYQLAGWGTCGTGAEVFLLPLFGESAFALAALVSLCYTPSDRPLHRIGMLAGLTTWYIALFGQLTFKCLGLI